MTYKDNLHPWCIVRLFPGMQSRIVGRFRRRSEAEAQIRLLRRMNPKATYTIMFNPPSDLASPPSPPHPPPTDPPRPSDFPDPSDSPPED